MSEMTEPRDNADLPSIRVGAIELKPGDPVRLWPLGRADIFDMVLKGKTAVIESIERDFEDRVYVAVVVDDDPGQDLGLQRQPGHRFFFFGVEEVELFATRGENAMTPPQYPDRGHRQYFLRRRRVRRRGGRGVFLRDPCRRGCASSISAFAASIWRMP